MSEAGLGHLVLFKHDHLEKWESSLHFGKNSGYFNTVPKETNILFGGGLDDVWCDPQSGLVFIVDYKSTANSSLLISSAYDTTAGEEAGKSISLCKLRMFFYAAHRPLGPFGFGTVLNSPEPLLQLG